MKQLIKAYRDFDPAAKSSLEILLIYPGIRALLLYRIAHVFHSKFKLFFLARALSEFARILTGIDIHPGAKLARSVIIEHGTGVVIGETSEIGDGTVILQGVTLGSRRISVFDTGNRHPIIGKKVMVGAGAKILGPITVGDGAWIGANSVVLTPVPARCSAIGIPEKIKHHSQLRGVA